VARAVLACVLMACAGARVSAQVAPAPTTAVPAPAVPAVLPAVVAHVNGEKVTREDFEKMIRATESNMGMPIPPEGRDTILRRLLDQLVVHTLLEQEAKARGLAATEADVQAKLRDVRQRFPSQLEFEQVLKERGMTLDSLRKDLGRDLTAEKVMNAELSALAAPGEDELKDFYAKNPDRFREEESIRASHILVRVARDADAATTAKAKASIDAVLEKAKAGQDFAALAREFSEDTTTGAQGGDLSYFRRGTMVPEFNDAAFALQPGQLSGVVTTQFGYHLIKVTDRKPGGMAPFEEAVPQIRQLLERQNRKRHSDAFIEGLKKKAKIEVLI
jgi:peptidyl-prolyl cis-trans isomerase C